MEHTLPVEAACGNSVVDMGPDESVLILIKHCRDMKQQESRLRLITLLLLISCMTLFVFTTSGDLRQHGNSGSSGQGSVTKQSPAYSWQERMCPSDNPEMNLHRRQIHLRSVPTESRSNSTYMKWDPEFGKNYNKERKAIEILETGHYFIYLRIALSCFGGGGPENFRRLYVELRKWNEGYNKTLTLTKDVDGVTCSPQGFRSVFIGQLFDLLKGDHVSVWIGEGYKLITRSSFGAYLV